MSLASSLNWMFLPAKLPALALAPRLPYATGSDGSQPNPKRRHVGLKRANTLKLLPSRLVSRIYGAVNNIPLPVAARPLVYGAWSWFFKVKLDEIPRPLSDYPTMTAFFTRRLREGVRQIDDASPLVSPVDGAVVSVSADMHKAGKLSQVKGIEYHLTDFLGIELPVLKPGNALFSAILYLSPGDYHRFHSPCDWTVTSRTHFAGQLLPVNPIVARMLPSLFCTNERVALYGEWEHGFFSYTAVGATNVGSIRIDFDPEVRTNTYRHDWHCGFSLSDALSWVPGQRPPAAGGAGAIPTDDVPHTPFTRPALTHSKVYDSPVNLRRGDDVGLFELGSTVVLVFEAPEDFVFTLRSNQKVVVGMPIGHYMRSDGMSEDTSAISAEEMGGSTSGGSGLSAEALPPSHAKLRWPGLGIAAASRFALPGLNRCDCGCGGTIHATSPAKASARPRARSAFAVLDGVTSWDLHGISVDLGDLEDLQLDASLAIGIEERVKVSGAPHLRDAFAGKRHFHEDEEDVDADDFHTCISSIAAEK